jgi:GT2 family glycosyltransferase
MSPAAVRSADSPKISVVVISHNEGRNLAWTVESLHETLPPDREILVVDDRSSDGSTDCLKTAHSGARVVCPRRRLGVAAARNWGAARARGTYIIFVDAHNTFPPGWQRPLTELLENPVIGAVAPAISDRNVRDRKGFGLRLIGPDLEVEWLDRQGDRPHAVPLLPGGCLAMRRDTFEAVGGFDEGLIRYGVEDSELSLRLWLLGYELWIVPGVEVAHVFREQIPYRVHWRTVLHNRLRMAVLHLNARRLARVVAALQRYREFASALALVMDSDVSVRRADWRARRVLHDDWFFQKFNLKW